MTREEIIERIKVMQAYINGEKVQYKKNACLYIKITGFVIIPLSSYVGRAAPLPKWFMRFSDWLEYLTGKRL